MLDALNESAEDKLKRQAQQLEELTVQVRRYGECLNVIVPLIYGTKQRIDRAVRALQDAGLEKFRDNGLYPQPHEI